MAAGSTVSPSTRLRPIASEAAVNRHSSGKAAHSVFQARPSRSCSTIIDSRSSEASTRASRARVTRCSDRSGFRLWGMVMLPTAPGVNGSETSPISGRWSSRTSLPILPRVAQIMASTDPNSAIRSRAEIHGPSGRPRPSSSQNRSWRARRDGPHREPVPAAPPSWPNSQRVPPVAETLPVAADLGRPHRQLVAEGDRGARAGRGSGRRSAWPGAGGPACGRRPRWRRGRARRSGRHRA